MTLLRTEFFFSKSTWTPAVVNAAPTIMAVTLNFDFWQSTGSVGDDIELTFDVIAGNAAPTTPVITLNFDLTSNAAPAGQGQDLIFEVAAA